MAESNNIRKCKLCFDKFLPKRKDSFFCSNSCRSKFFRFKRIKNNIENNIICSFDGCNNFAYNKGKCKSHYSKEYRLENNLYKQITEKKCKHCNINFFSKGNNKKFCSVSCGGLFRARINGIKPAIRINEIICNECKKLFKPKKSERSTFCSRECSIKNQSSNAIKSLKRNYESFKSCKKRRKERIKLNGYEIINKLKVFERDKWKCHICGCKTPKELKGTMAMNSPEIDHIVPIASGGSHTYSNVACACKRCNIKKSTKPIGQLNFGII